jgi:hypothetical protein
MSVAQDTGGEAAAGPWFDRAKATYTTLIDPTHKVSSLFNLVNVPSGVWIDEQGRIVRINEGTYSAVIPLGNNFEIGTADYTPAVRDWVLKGAASEYVWTPEKVASKIRRRTADEALAEPTFKLGVYFFQRQDEARARTYWKRAEELHPDSWNYHRQDWTFTAETSFGRSFQQKRSALGDKPYYEPLDLPPAGGQPSPSGQQAPRPDRR